ncbi:hypothetical protein [Pantoea anthophila]|uniref:hypothetical protein n=1 Tax=Pantoea anthophila TaxID=470931 RepID=UPI003333D1D1
MNVQAYHVAVRVELDDQITRNLQQVSRDATSALQALNRSLLNEFMAHPAGLMNMPVPSVRQLTRRSASTGRLGMRHWRRLPEKGAAVDLATLGEGCSAFTLRTVWQRPGYAGPAVKSLKKCPDVSFR